ncbi:hypothetical protein B1F69_04500 [Pseudomonas syringae]|uniref:hypothetical protein n=1 Tax=Pseudomonas syringae TaxID=317 RepID=UPI00101180D4|nr:hypothetical protein [Pseudomonas syringae]RXU01336.1 hypothetical protein B1F69_04500 [Pseudomonas syringae]
MSNFEYDDPGHEADLRAERRRQLEGDISPEEAAEECAWLDVAEHIKRFGTTAKGKTESFDKLTKHLADRQSGLGWQDAWTLRLRDLGVKNRLPRGFNAKTLSERG